MEPEETKPSGRVALILDVENIVSAIRKDEKLEKLPAGELLSLAINVIGALARKRYGQVEVAYAALALPDGFGQGMRRTKEALKNVEILVRHGFSVFVVAAGRDAADMALCQEVSAILQANPKVDTVLLCTEDGGLHFRDLMSHIWGANKEVGIVAYDNPAQVLRATWPRIELICGQLRIAASELHEKRQTASTGPVQVQLSI